MIVDRNKIQDESQPRRRRRSWLWFAIGFLLVFVCTSVTYTMYYMHPSGNAIVQCKLCEYYLIEGRRALRPVTVLGPASGSRSVLATTGLLHLLVSAVGGAAMMGIGWVFYKIKGR